MQNKKPQRNLYYFVWYLSKDTWSELSKFQIWGQKWPEINIFSRYIGGVTYAAPIGAVSRFVLVKKVVDWIEYFLHGIDFAIEAVDLFADFRRDIPGERHFLYYYLLRLFLKQFKLLIKFGHCFY